MPVETSERPRGAAPDRPAGGVSAASASFLAVAVMAAVTAAMTYSVVRYRLWIVAVYLAATLLLAVRLRRDGGAVRLGRAGAAAAVLACGIVTLAVPGYTYLRPGPAAGVRLAVAGTALLVAVLLLLPWRRAADAAVLAAACGHTAVVAALVRLDPAPRIDVWYTLQGFADALLDGDNPYSRVWVGPPGIMRSFTYLPWTGTLVAPGRWLLGDVRWALLAAMLLGALALRAAGRAGTVPGTGGTTPPATSLRTASTIPAAAAAAVLLLLPGTPTQAEQAWTEPLLLASLAGTVVALRRGRTLVAVLLVGLALASKQHIALLLPLFAAWRPFGLRRSVAAGLVAAGLVSPFLLTAPGDMVHDTITYLVTFPALRFSNTLYLAAVNDLGRSPPFWLTGVVVLGTLAAVTRAVHRRRPGPAEFLRWCALVLAVANLVNKQAFYNQYWLVVALVVLSWALPQDERADDVTTVAGRPGTGGRCGPVAPPDSGPVPPVTR